MLQGLVASSTHFRPKKKRALGSSTWVHKDKRKTSQIDYICYSKRWASDIVGSRVRWGPSRRRFGFPYHWDHGLVEVKLRHRVRMPQKVKDRADLTMLKHDAIAECYEAKVEMLIAKSSPPEGSTPSIEDNYRRDMERLCRAEVWQAPAGRN